MRYVKATSIDHAVELLSGNESAFVLAGGSDILVKLKMELQAPEFLIDIKGIQHIKDVTLEAGGIRIGAAVPAAEMGAHAALKGSWPGLVEAVELIGSTQVQGRATMVGNLCNGSPAADSVPAMLTAGAVAQIAGPNGKRDALVADLLVGPGKINLGKAEFITSVFLPAIPARTADAYLRFIPRTEMDIAVVGAAVRLSLDENGVVTDAQIALGAVGPVALMVPEAASSLIGTKLDQAALEHCATACRAACTPIDDKRGTIEFRTKIAGVLAVRAAKIAYTRAGGSL